MQRLTVEPSAVPELTSWQRPCRRTVVFCRQKVSDGSSTACVGFLLRLRGCQRSSGCDRVTALRQESAPNIVSLSPTKGPAAGQEDKNDPLMPRLCFSVLYLTPRSSFLFPFQSCGLKLPLSNVNLGKLWKMTLLFEREGR